MFLRDKPVKLFVLLRDGSVQWHVSGLAKASGMSFFHASNLLEQLASDGFVVFELKGKFKFVKLTEKGLVLANLLSELNAKFRKEVKKEVVVEQKPEAPVVFQPPLQKSVELKPEEKPPSS